MVCGGGLRRRYLVEGRTLRPYRSCILGFSTATAGRIEGGMWVVKSRFAVVQWSSGFEGINKNEGSGCNCHLHADGIFELGS